MPILTQSIRASSRKFIIFEMQNTINDYTAERIGRWLRETGILKLSAGIVPAASAFGLICLTIYYGSLNFTPDISFAQGALVAVQAGVMGAALLGSLWISFSMPALIYQFMGLRPGDLVPRHRKVATKHLVSRYFWTQLAAIALISMFVYFPHREQFENAVYWGVATNVFIWASLHVAFSPLIWGVDGLEKRSTFIASVFTVGFAAVISLLTLLVVRSGSPSAHSDARFLMTVSVVMALGCAQVAIGAGDLALRVGFGVVVLLEVAFLLGAPGLYPRYVANAIGIAEKAPVRVIVDTTACRTIHAAAEHLLLNCDSGETAIENVEVLNSLGSRWVVRVPAGSGPTIILPGKDLVIVRPQSSDAV
ncbi:hypothetical protein [Paraburkholderia terrae]|uniref:Uncharacterized protein n=1 Tax=Paraburkholderia terrae TaxID=311230 RepID=A0A2I8F360_9BURK|nr:hypothetical protein [Paraburkholderia terrae]AUT66285.1 hypothetical protein C2L65_41825 [Paraburkholderia terrae]